MSCVSVKISNASDGGDLSWTGEIYNKRCKDEMGLVCLFGVVKDCMLAWQVVDRWRHFAKLNFNLNLTFDTDPEYPK